jgi:hypothetical protein
MNIFTVAIKDGGITHTRTVKGEGMTEAQAIRAAVSKQPKRLREAVEAGECEITVTADVNNK